MSGIDSARDEKWSEWMDWSGGECPLKRGEMCCVKYRNGEVRNNVPAGVGGGLVSGGGYDTTDTYWRNDSTSVDIIAYRYKIKEPEGDMHPDLEWLATNVSEWASKESLSMARKSPIGAEFYDPEYCPRDDGYTMAQWLQARRDLGLVTSPRCQEINQDEEEAFREIEKRQEAKPDNVNHPPHYQSDNCIECIDAIRAALGLDGFVAHCRGTAIKYSWRSGKKQAHAEDLRKAAWYLTRAAEAIEE